jgi:hypothetical protein
MKCVNNLGISGNGKQCIKKRLQQMLENVEIMYAHYLVENKISWHPTHILSSARTVIPVILLPAKQKQKT